MRIIASKGYWHDLDRKVKNQSYTDAIQKYQKDLILNCTEGEKRLKQIFNAHDVGYDFQKVFNVTQKKKKKFKIVDFYLTGYNLVVEVDGGYHNRVKQNRKDFIRSKQLLKLTKINNVVRFTEDEALNLPEIKIMMRIESYA